MKRGNRNTVQVTYDDRGSSSDDGDAGGDEEVLRHSSGASVFTQFVVGLINVTGGLVFGFTIGMTAILVHAHREFAQCSGVASDAHECARLEHCAWDADDAQCVASRSAACAAFTSAAECDAAGDGRWCVFRRGAGDTCEAVLGWSAWETGTFVAAMTLGGLLGSLIAAASRSHTRRRDLAIATALYLCSSIASVIFWLSDDFWPLAATRVGVGVGVGVYCVLCPLYVSESVPPAAASLLGTLFQVFITLGIAFAALCGWMLQSDFRTPLAMFSLSCFLATQMFPVLWMQKTSCIPLPQTPDGARSDPEDEQQEQEHSSTPSGVSLLLDKSMRKPLAAALVLSLAQQGTGINAVMGYAPTMAAAAGAAPLTGNLIIMLWNFVTTLLAIPLVKRLPPRALFLLGLAGVSASCVLLFVGLSGLHRSQDVSGSVFWGGLTSVALSAFILAFECGMGPMFFVLATELFPQRVRDAGCSFVNVTQFIFNLVIAFCYPLLVEAWSPSSAETAVGTSRAFLLFGIIGATSLVALRRLLR